MMYKMYVVVVCIHYYLFTFLPSKLVTVIN